MFSQQNLSDTDNDTAAAEPHEKIENPGPVDTPHQKRNSGSTGPTSETGRATSARNATRHGMCATTLIMQGEVEADWLELLQTWLEAYQSPAESTLLYTSSSKPPRPNGTASACNANTTSTSTATANRPSVPGEPTKSKTHDLILRYLTAAERRFQREYRILEQHWKSHHKNCGANTRVCRVETHLDASSSPTPNPPEKQMPKIRYVNSETGESVDAQGNEYPPPPDWKPIPIIPGVYPPNHPASQPPWREEKFRR